MKIKEKVNRVITEVENDPSGAIAERLGYRAVEAIIEGIGSPAWEEYMQTFADTPAQLKRLTFEDARSQEADIKKNVVYLVAYAACGAATLTKTRDAIDEIIDDGL